MSAAAASGPAARAGAARPRDVIVACMDAAAQLGAQLSAMQLLVLVQCATSQGIGVDSLQEWARERVLALQPTVEREAAAAAAVPAAQSAPVTPLRIGAAMRRATAEERFAVVAAIDAAGSSPPSSPSSPLASPAARARAMALAALAPTLPAIPAAHRSSVAALLYRLAPQFPRSAARAVAALQGRPAAELLQLTRDDGALAACLASLGLHYTPAPTQWRWVVRAIVSALDVRDAARVAAVRALRRRACRCRHVAHTPALRNAGMPLLARCCARAGKGRADALVGVCALVPAARACAPALLAARHCQGRGR